MLGAAGSTTLNRQWRLIARPEGEVSRTDFSVTEGDVPTPGPNEVLVRNIYLFVPPSMRLWMNEKDSYFPAQVLGEVMAGITLGIVEQSNAPALPVGTFVNGMGGVQLYSVAPAEYLMPLNPAPGVPLAAYRTVLDVQGLTAYCGLTEIGQPKPGETLVVTAAAGSVGSLVCQIGKKLGLKVIGIAGGAAKCAWLTEACGIDAAIDYKSDDVAARLDALIPEGVDVVFENVGGPVFDRLLERLRPRARVALCGLISSYNHGAVQSTTALMQVVNKQARIQGFLVLDFMQRHAEIARLLESWILDGSLVYEIDILDGMDNLIDGMASVFSGRNRGSLLIRLSDEPAG